MEKAPSNIIVLVTRKLPPVGISMLQREGFHVNVWLEERPMTPQELLEEAIKANALLSLLTDRLDANFLNKCKHLDIISQFSVGYDNIDIPEATRLGIAIGYAPGAMSNATADTAFGLMIAVSRKMTYQHQKIKKGEWTYFKPMQDLGIELKDKTLGIFGMGRIGLEMAKRCKGAYGMRVIYHNRHRNLEAEKSVDAEYVSFDELLRSSDVLSVHCTLSEETKGIFQKDVFGRMKSTAIFVNTARGLVHNEDDLLQALEEGQIWGAGLDVTNPEPMRPDNPLLDMPNVVVLPHIGSATEEARSEMSRLAALNIVEYYKHNNVPNMVNPEVSSR